MHVGCCSVAGHNSSGLLSSSQLLSKSGRSCSSLADRSLVKQGAPECAQAGKENASAFWLTRTTLVLTHSLKSVSLQRPWFCSKYGQRLGGAQGAVRTTMLSAHGHLPKIWARGSESQLQLPGLTSETKWMAVGLCQAACTLGMMLV